MNRRRIDHTHKSKQTNKRGLSDKHFSFSFLISDQSQSVVLSCLSFPSPPLSAADFSCRSIYNDLLLFCRFFCFLQLFCRCFTFCPGSRWIDLAQALPSLILGEQKRLLHSLHHFQCFFLKQSASRIKLSGPVLSGVLSCPILLGKPWENIGKRWGTLEMHRGGSHSTPAGSVPFIPSSR